ncbi:MAG: hypothetical protein ABIA37_04590 [Candidatus Woesearchaeota archaeon]
MRYQFLQVQDYPLTFLQENIEMFSYSLLAFFVPLLMGHPQFVVGTMVNAALVLAALNLKGAKLLPVILLPSLGVLSRGMIFGPFTIFLLIMIPFIWIGNSLLVFSIKEFYLRRKYNKYLSLGIGISFKVAFLFSMACVLVKASILPVLFLTAMGLTQVYTAVAGSALAVGVQFTKKRLA